MFTIEPPPPSNIRGRKARIVRCIDFTLRSNEKSQSSSEQSRMVPMHKDSGVEQNIDLADTLGHRGDRGGVARIELGDLGNAFTPQRSEPFLVDIGCEHGRAFAREGERTATADSGRGCGHECALALEAVRHFLFSLSHASLRGAKRRSNPGCFRGGIPGLLRWRSQ